jgi:hypothetical protein
MKHSTMFVLSLALTLLPLSSTAFAEDKAPPTESKPAPTAGEASADVKAGTGVEKREIVGEATSFPAGTTVWVWSLVHNAEGNVKHVWKRDGKDVWTATMKIGSKKWSTSSRRTIPKAGSWEVDVQTLDGTSIGSIAFTVN